MKLFETVSFVSDWKGQGNIMTAGAEKYMSEQVNISERITYRDMFWLFMIGNIFGVLFEGIWCFLRFGRWETHVVTVWGPFCLIYGIGFVALYISAVKLRDKSMWFRFLSIALILDAVEYFCGWLIDFALGMKAWDYSENFLNIKGRICFGMTLFWGAAGLLFARFAVPALQRLFCKIQGKAWKGVCVVLSVFMAVNIAATAVCMVRWSARHQGVAPATQIGELADTYYGDEFMEQRFVEWNFISD